MTAPQAAFLEEVGTEPGIFSNRLLGKLQEKKGPGHVGNMNRLMKLREELLGMGLIKVEKELIREGRGKGNYMLRHFRVLRRVTEVEHPGHYIIDEKALGGKRPITNPLYEPTSEDGPYVPPRTIRYTYLRVERRPGEYRDRFSYDPQMLFPEWNPKTGYLDWKNAPTPPPTYQEIDTEVWKELKRRIPPSEKADYDLLARLDEHLWGRSEGSYDVNWEVREKTVASGYNADGTQKKWLQVYREMKRLWVFYDLAVKGDAKRIEKYTKMLKEDPGCYGRVTRDLVLLPDQTEGYARWLSRELKRLKLAPKEENFRIRFPRDEDPKLLDEVEAHTSYLGWSPARLLELARKYKLRMEERRREKEERRRVGRPRKGPDVHVRDHLDDFDPKDSK